MTVDNVTLQQKNSTTFLGSVAKGTFKLGQATTLAVSGVSLMVIGVGGAYLTTVKLQQFFLNEGEDAKGFEDIPGFTHACKNITKFLHVKTGYPEQDSEFCESLGSKPFAEQEGMYGPASLASVLGASSLSYLGSLYSFLGGMSLVNQSIEVFTSIL